MDSESLLLLRADLRAANYCADAVAALLGASADSARIRGVFVPAIRVLDERGISPLSALTRLFLLGETIDDTTLDAALPKLRAAGALRLGLVALDPVDSGAAVFRAALSLNPVAVIDAYEDAPRDWWIISDLDDQLRRAPARPDHVMGIGGATRSLIAQAPVVTAPTFALDLGTGCGIVAMHLALRGGRVIATDISERALTIAQANATLNDVAGAIEFRQGSLFEPVSEERFDVILSNPPFVITPRASDGPVYEYRDGGLVGDALAAAVVRTGPAHLAPGGTMLCLANWETPWGGNGLSRVREWIADASVDSHVGAVTAWVIERDRLEPVQYAETWARDGGARPGTAEFDGLLAAWIDDFADRRIVAVGLGAIRIRRESTAEESVVHVEQATGALAVAGLGSDLQRAFESGSAAARMSDAEVLSHRWLHAASVSEERIHQPGQEAPQAITLITDTPIARRVAADPLLAAAVGASDGELTLGQIADALATLLEVDTGAASEAVIAGARELAWLGMLSPKG